MLAWFKRWLGGRSEAAAAPNSSSGMSEPVTAVVVLETPEERTLEDSIAAFFSAEGPPPLPLTPDQEAQVGPWVMKVIEHVTKRKVDPPVVPALAPRVLALVQEEDVDIAALVKLIEQDLAISAKLISVANSAAFRRGNEIATVREAALHLGSEQVAQVAIGLACRSMYDSEASARPGQARSRWGRLFEHAMTTGYASVHMAAARGLPNASEAFLAGLFHDVGKAMALRALETLTRGGEMPEEPVIAEVLHRVHAYPGDEFTAQWSLPGSLMAVCCDHHQLEDRDDASEFTVLVSLASSIDGVLRKDQGQEVARELPLCAARLDLSAKDFEGFVARTRTFAARVESMFD